MEKTKEHKGSLMAVAYDKELASLELGAYSVAEAARFTKAHPNTVRSWFRDVPHRKADPIFRSDHAGTERENLLSFLDLVDTKIAVEMKRRDVSMQKIRRVNQTLQEYWDVPHPFCYRKFYVSKGDIYAEIEDDRGILLIEVLTKQGFDKTVMTPFLHQLDFNDDTEIAERWNISPGIVLDPRVRFGEPVVEGTRIPARNVAKLYFAEGRDAIYTGEVFGLKAQDVLNAVRFYQFFGNPLEHERSAK